MPGMETDSKWTPAQLSGLRCRDVENLARFRGRTGDEYGHSGLLKPRPPRPASIQRFIAIPFALAVLS